jgi:LuxR family transcriptional regulator, quorum-sensing system regulator BjaR1
MRSIGSGTRAALRKRAKALTTREIEVLYWVARGKSSWEIGEILNISQRTVVEHVKIVVLKMGAANRVHAVALAVRDRIIEV